MQGLRVSSLKRTLLLGCLAMHAASFLATTEAAAATAAAPSTTSTVAASASRLVAATTHADDHDHDEDHVDPLANKTAAAAPTASAGQIVAVTEAADHDDHEHETCGGHGELHGDHCDCDNGYVASPTNKTLCIAATNPTNATNGNHDDHAHDDHEEEGHTTQCGGHGDLHGDHCDCHTGYTASATNKTLCVPVTVKATLNSSKECNGVGHLHDGKCHCDSGFMAPGVNTSTCVAMPEPAMFSAALMTEYGSNGTMTSTGLEALFKALNLTVTSAPEEEDHSGHNHRRRRATDDLNTCLSAEQVLEMLAINSTAGISAAQLSEITPVMVQMLESGVCKPAVTSEPIKTDDHGLSKSEVYGYAMASAIVVSLLALLAIVLLPCLAHRGNSPNSTKGILSRFIIMLLVSLGASVMLGDAILHLIPMGLGVHASHGGEDAHAGHAHGSEEELTAGTIQARCSVVLAGVFFLYILEKMLHVSGHFHSHGGFDRIQHDAYETAVIKANAAPDHTQSDAGKGSIKNEDATPGNTAAIEIGNPATPTTSCSTATQGTGPFGLFPIWRNTTTVAWVVLIGDAAHNFVDGIALGAAFHLSVSTGLSTALAIVLHELPQELADFGILTSNGFSWNQALMFNFLSALTCLVGVVIGVETSTEAQPWIIMFTAGMFIYISLYDMLPQLSQPQLQDKARPVWTMAVQYFGLALGWVVMLLMGLYEEDISVSLS